MRTLKVGFVGSGFIAQFHAWAMESVRNMEVTGVYSPRSPQPFAAFARSKNLGPATIYPSVTELAKNVDVVAIFSPNFSTLEVMEELVAAKKAGAAVRGVICDKPLGRNMKESMRLVQLAEEGNLLTAYFENQIHMKAIKTQREQLRPQQKSMGPLTLARCAEEHAGPHKPWFWDPTRQGGGVLSDMGCHSIAVGWFVLNPIDKPLTYLEPISVSCDIALLKWGQPYWREKLLREQGVDYSKTPAEDFACGVITFRNPETKQLVKLQFSDSWMYDKQGLRLYMEGIGPGYAFEVNTLQSSLNIFIGDAAASAVANQEAALEKSTASRGLLAVQANEADLYGYIDENKDACESFLAGRHGFLPLSYGLEINRLVMASYMAAEKRQTLDLTDPRIRLELETFVPLVQQGRGAEVLF
jgi:predicted dehydrogenase